MKFLLVLKTMVFIIFVPKLKPWFGSRSIHVDIHDKMLPLNYLHKLHNFQKISSILTVFSKQCMYTSTETSCTSVGKPFSPGFPTGSTNPRLKGPSFSPGAKEASQPGHVGRPFSPGWYYQPGLKVFLIFVSIFN